MNKYLTLYYFVSLTLDKRNDYNCICLGQFPNRKLLNNKNNKCPKKKLTYLTFQLLTTKMVEIPSGEVELRDDRTKQMNIW